MGIELDLNNEFEEIIKKARDRGFTPTRFMQMLSEHGAVVTAKRLLATQEPQTGLFELYHLGLLNESMEAIVIKEKYSALFAHEEIAEAKKRLEELGYFK